MWCLQAYGRKLQKHEFDSQDSILAYLSTHGNGSGDAQLKENSLALHFCLVHQLCLVFAQTSN